MNSENEKYYLEQDKVIDDTLSEYQYEVVPVEQQAGDVELDEDFDKAIKVLREIEEDQKRLARHEVPVRPSLGKRPEVIDDLVRNFLVRTRMLRTLETFQTEWYELSDRGILNQKELTVVPDVYSQNQQLQEQLAYVSKERDRYKDIALKARDSYVKIRKERDFHRINHRRLVQEKNRLIADIHRLKQHYASFEPVLHRLKQKYVTAMKEKMLASIERDRLAAQAAVGSQAPAAVPASSGGSAAEQQRMGAPVGGPRAEIEERARKMASFDIRNAGDNFPNDSQWPADRRVNPDLAKIKGPPGHLTRIGGYRLNNSFQAHNLPVSSVSVHPERNALVTSSDDRTWKLWSLPSAQNVLTGRGHTDWVSCAQFDKSGKLVATSSGDHTVRLWESSSAKCVHTFKGHGLPVWYVDWHWSGNFLASASMDGSVKIWDINSERCRETLRGHSESANAVVWVPYSNILLSCSADKTLIMWDARTGLPGQTLLGHSYAITHCAISQTAERLASADAFGVVKVWDPRTAAAGAATSSAQTLLGAAGAKGQQSRSLHTLDIGPQSANWVAFDNSSALLAVASSASTVRLFELANQKLYTLSGHDEAVQSVAFDPEGEFLASVGSDLSVRVWS